MTFHLSTPKDVQAVRDFLDGLVFDGKKYVAEIKQKRERRTIDQNSLYWLWCTCIEQETGQPKEDIHEFFKMKFLGVSERHAFNLTFFVPNSTTKLDTKQFTDYLDQIQAFASTDLSITLPNPEDLQWESFYNHYKQFMYH